MWHIVYTDLFAFLPARLSSLVISHHIIYTPYILYLYLYFLFEPHQSHCEGEGSGPPDWGISPYGLVTGSRSSFLGCHCKKETKRL